MVLPDGSFKPSPESTHVEPKIFLPPNAALRILFTSHGSKEDLGNYGNFRSLVRNADIFIPEMAGWEDIVLTTFRDISKGKEKAYEDYTDSLLKDEDYEYKDFALALLNTIYGSHRK